MIQTEIVKINGRNFVHTWSDEHMKIERDGIRYEEAYDPEGLDRVYTETDELIPVDEDEDEDN